MKRAVLLLSAFVCTLAAAISCSPGPRTADGQPIPDRVMGVYLPYPEAVDSAPGTPESYEPFYISHYGRHGSRYLLCDSQYVFVHDILSRAAADGKLTKSGKKAHADFLAIYPQFEGRAGMLTGIGAAQHRAIARRMAERYPSAFGRGAAVRASTSATSRTQESMEACCTQLQACCPSLRITCATDAALNPYSAGSGIPTECDLKVKGPEAEWRPDFEAFCRQEIDAEHFAARIFSDTDYAAGLCDLTDLERGIFYLAIHFRGCGIATDWLRLFTLDELYTLAACDAYTFYMEKGPAAETSDRTWALSAHILNKMLTDAETDIADGTAANLRFGHDGCIMALLTLMESDGWTGAAATQEEIARAWDVSQIPMACNLQWIFYRPAAGEGEPLVRVLLNERPLRLPVTDRDGLCGWNDLKQYLAERCDTAFAILNKDQKPNNL
ncbi:MAG: hypothetical protein LUF83_10755 [Alistipes sp.]|nr:hypothetical protein [Alistipes sp.]